METKRLISFFLMVIITIIAVVNDVAFIIVVALLTMGGLYEFFYMIKKKDIPIYSYTGIFIGVLIPVSIYTRFELTKNWELLFTVTVFLIILLMQFNRKDNRNAIVGIATTLFGIFYVSWLFSFLVKIRYLLPGIMGAQLVAFIILVTKAGDVGALLIGTSFGRHPLIPHISPKKSVEGCFGSLFFSCFAAVIVKSFLPHAQHLSLWQIMAVGTFFGGIGQLGDISESLIKRDCHVKDSGKLLPGLGGVLDILDSLLFSVPVFYLYMSSVLKIF